MKRYDDYVERYCRTGKCTPEEAHTHALVKEVKNYYEREESTQQGVCQEFVCCSERQGS